jgi:nucleotide-binding universal stress UspA family protein
MLVPLDGSRLAEEVFPYARELAGRLDLDLFFLHVCGPGETELLPMRRFYVEKMAEMVMSQTHEIQRTTGMPAGKKTIEAAGTVVTGYPAEEILKYAEDHHIDMILMSTHGHSGVRRWALGSVAYKVLHASKVPVWLVHSGTPGEIVYDKWPKRTILVPLDGSRLAEAALSHAEALVRQRGTQAVEILLLSVYEPVTNSAAIFYLTPGDYAPGTPYKWEDYVKEETAKAKEACEKYLLKVADRLKSAGIRVRTGAIQGNAVDEIVKYANENPFQVIVMSSHGRSGLSHLAFGSVAEKILLEVNIPIFMILPQTRPN